MNKPVNKGDILILSTIANYKFLTVKQLCFLQQRSDQVIRRRLRYLRKIGLISIIERVFGPGPGRNEHITILSTEGNKLLQSEKTLDEQTEYVNSQSYDSSFVEHDLLVNWFLIHLIQLERLEKRFKISAITSDQQHLSHDGLNQMSRIVLHSDNNKINDIDQVMIPDGVFTITDKPSNKSLLFFFEIDRGTESLTSASRNSKNIEQKINDYKALFKNGAYKSYNKIAKNPLNGFRLLFLTNTTTRMDAICRLTRSMPPSDFIWVTEQNRMFREGIGSGIWYRGGKTNNEPESILGKKSVSFSPINIK